MKKRILIFGIGKFGNALVKEFLSQSNIDLELIDKNEKNLGEFAEENLELHCINTEEKNKIEEIGIEVKDICMVLFGTNIGTSVITVQNLLDLNIKNIYVQIINKQHKKIIQSLGITKFIEPNKIAAKNSSFTIGKNLDITSFDEKNYICRIKNEKIDKKQIKELTLRDEHNINILMIKRVTKEGKIELIQPEANKLILKGDEFILWVGEDKLDKINNIFK